MSLVIMLRRAHLFARNSCSWDKVLDSTPWILVLVPLILMVVYSVQEGIASQKKLRLLVTQNTPISGFYAPGSWWAWLITLGMTHAHMVVSLMVSANPWEEWDYDLIGASGYIIAAAIDLTLKGRAISHLGDSACGSPLLPAFLCAERAVSVGTGSSLFTIATASYIGRFGFSARRRVGIAIIPLVFVIVALGYSFRARQAIFRTAPDMPCRLPDGSGLKPEMFFVLVDVPTLMVVATTDIVPAIYMSRSYWLFAAIMATLAALHPLMDRKPPWSILIESGLTFALLPLGILVFAIWILFIWLAAWALLWGVQYIIAFFPEMGYFPITGMSVMDMDQLAALLGIGFIAAFRTGLRHQGKRPLLI
ncbi:hypothetical protein MSAN_00471700 [Mycena sanguinolenta]|uniref:Uncharacterized protein n=1 Tax=Mycena sanguinolenta TaxID=230812 RepID=A0A8H6ZBD1_9AGAR|nr:hypothetical protein MSAN_00471700 [Mycena sanguinolenta]